MGTPLDKGAEQRAGLSVGLTFDNFFCDACNIPFIDGNVWTASGEMHTAKPIIDRAELTAGYQCVKTNHCLEFVAVRAWLH